jgi:hypothetical protein
VEAGARPDRAGRPLVIAHRGASASRPENTLSAYALAVEQRSDMIEIDLHRTRDGEIVITHDQDLAGLGGDGEIADATFASVRALDAGDGQRVPTLDEVLDVFGSRIPFNLELKRGTRIEYPDLEAASIDAVERRGLLDTTLFSSFYDSVLGRPGWSGRAHWRRRRCTSTCCWPTRTAWRRPMPRASRSTSTPWTTRTGCGASWISGWRASSPTIPTAFAICWNGPDPEDHRGQLAPNRDRSSWPSSPDSLDGRANRALSIRSREAPTL